MKTDDVSIISSSEQFHNLQNDWNELSTQTTRHSFFQAFTWAWAWWEHLGQSLGYRLCIVTIRQHDQLRLIWPLVQRRQGPWQVTSWLGAESGHYADILLTKDADPAILNQAWHAIKHSLGTDVINLADIRADAVIAPYLERQLGKPVISSHSPYCDISEWQDWEALRTSLKRRFRKDLRRRRRRLQEQGELTFQLIEHAEDIAAIIAQSLKHKQAWLKKRGLYGRFLERPETLDWLTQTALAAQQNQSLILTVLKLDNKLIATALSFLHDNHLHAYFASFDLEFASYSAGTLHTEDTIKWALEQGITTFDLMPPRDSYKLSWAKHAIEIQAYTHYPTLWGSLAKLWYSIGCRELALQIYHCLPRTLRQSAARLLGS